MQNKKLVVAILACLLITTSSAVFPAFAAQPPVDTTTYYVGTIGQPRRADPARAYDTASGELIFNCYDQLIAFSDKPLMPDTTAEVTADKVADLSKFKPELATALPTISPDGKTWTFTIRDGIKFHPWKKADGTIVTGQIMTAEDVEYSFERMLVQDMSGAPSWMLCLPLCGYMFFPSAMNETTMGALVDNAITRSGNTVTFNFKSAWPQTAMMQILAQTWGSIVNKAFCIEHGCWDGSFAAGWQAKYRKKPSNSYSPLDRYMATSKYPESASDVPAMCGTGPYKFTSWNKATLEWREDKFDDYWGGWAGNHLTTIIVKGVPEWPTRKMQFLAGEFDSLAVPRANMWDLLDASDPTGHTPLAGITNYYNSPQLSNDVMFFCFNVAAESAYMSKVPSGGDPAPDLFANVHVRRAFAYSINFTRYLAEAWFHEAIQPASWWVQGLKPDYENKSLVKYNLDLTVVENELKASGLWDSGFETTIAYNLGNDQRKIAAELVRDTVQSLNAKRSGKPPFKINVIGLDWPVILDAMEAMTLPAFFIGWLADFADADNFARPYMHTEGDFSYFQGYSDPHVDELIDTAIVTPDGPARKAIYEELQYIYWRDVVSLPIIQAVGRRWQRDWVRGWYFNQLDQGALGNWFYDLYKTVGAAVQPVDVSAVGSISAVGGSKLRITPNGAKMTNLKVTMSIHRLDKNPAAAAITVIMVLTKINATGYADVISRCDAMVVLTVASPDFTEEFVWNESATLSGVEAQYASRLLPGNYTLGGRVSVFSAFAYDSDQANNIVISAGGPIEVTVLVGDLNNDGSINIIDVATAGKAFGADSTKPNWNPTADMNLDGIINILDLAKIAKAFGTSL